MRIAYVCSDFGIPIHGDERASAHVRGLCLALQRQGHEVVILSPWRGGDAPPDFDVEVWELRLEPPERRVYELLSEDPGGGEAAAREVRALLYAASLRYRLHGILSVVRPDVIYERHSLLGSGGHTVARALGIPQILEVSAHLAGEQQAHRGLAFGRTARALEGAVLCAADRVIAPSRPLAAWLEKIGVASERIAVVPSGIDVDRFTGGAAAREVARAGLGIGPAERVVGFIGTFQPWHGPATLVLAVAALRRRGMDVRLLLVGYGPERSHLEALVRSHGIADATIFAGSAPYAKLPAMLAAMDVVTTPYGKRDDLSTLPLELIEAMAAGCPVVAAATDQVVDTVRDRETGLLFPPGDTMALAEALAALLVDRVWAAELGRAARADIRAGRTWEANAQAVVQVIEQVRQHRRLEPANGWSLI